MSGIFNLITNQSWEDRMIIATNLLNTRIYGIMELRDNKFRKAGIGKNDMFAVGSFHNEINNNDSKPKT